MSSRSRSVEKKPSRPTNPSGKTKSAGRSQSGTNKKAKRERSAPRSSSKAKTSSKKRNRSDVSRSKSKSSVSSKKSKENGIVVRKKSSTKKVSIQNDPCVCGPDFYANVLGPTADETILVGLETFMRFCHECPEKKEENLLVDSGTGLSTRESEESTSGKQSTSSNQLLDESSTTDTPEKEVLVAEVALDEKNQPEEEAPVVTESSGRNVSIKKSPPKQSSGKSLSLNDPPLTESTIRKKDSKERSIREEPAKDKSEEKLSVIEYEKGDEKGDKKGDEKNEDIEKIASKTGASQTPSKVDSKYQTASASSSQTDEPEVKDDVSQTGSKEEVGSSQTSQQSSSDAESQTDSSRLKESGSLSKHNRSTNSRMTTVNSTGEGKCSSDSSTSSSKLKDSNESCPCYPCSHCMDITSSETTSPTDKSSPCSCPSCKRPAPKRSCLKSPKCKCHTSTSPSSNVIEKRQVRVNCVRTPQTVSVAPTTVDLDLEESSENVTSAKGDADVGCFEVRYAITKITKFCSYTTFEVMRSTRKKPKVMPKSLEEVFVLKNCVVKNATPVVS